MRFSAPRKQKKIVLNRTARIAQKRAKSHKNAPNRAVSNRAFTTFFFFEARFFWRKHDFFGVLARFCAICTPQKARFVRFRTFLVVIYTYSIVVCPSHDSEDYTSETIFFLKSSTRSDLPVPTAHSSETSSFRGSKEF